MQQAYFNHKILGKVEGKRVMKSFGKAIAFLVIVALSGLVLYLSVTLSPG
ncbi:hypothetical protein J1TS5_47230 [Paenibacillus macerans]|nr:hypothetical protein J1TS5_47230 [Paenibacillus macerans]